MDPFVRLDQTAHRREDNRGWLEVLYESDSMVLKRSFSRKGVFRGLHVQMAPSAQTKVIRVVSGSIIDVVVDVADPALELKTTTLTPADGWVRIEAQYAHGFYALEDTVFEYACDGGYDEASEQAWSIADRLPELLGVTTVILSDKDRAAPPLSSARGVA
ncbi:MAG: dTDP-4-dehydrorhamnose 3,5-epimerase family protein [Brevundimonas sp.]|uniref:dTDP-4-dehydrorhamnose 3,5-epimerase family protein n=1 Tax=Brevundimonas sp. TaxID=1871086 RepID=UPI001A1E565C|nr:dTDP-4-dehydrorhamnose 3,5-epimerase family protein [Brevundimonas sp.]MBJ7446921.1 dTDP-4-dehydrorhamnose 3,5-epimerase family protein [Brevundimonas sp.]